MGTTGGLSSMAGVNSVSAIAFSLGALCLIVALTGVTIGKRLERGFANIAEELRRIRTDVDCVKTEARWRGHK